MTGTMLGLSRMKAEGHFVGVIPLCENMPSGRALKPGDVVRTRAGITVEVGEKWCLHVRNVRTGERKCSNLCPSSFCATGLAMAGPWMWSPSPKVLGGHVGDRADVLAY